MACSFTIDSAENLDQVYQLAMSEIKNYAGTFSGDINGGTFRITALGGNFEGSFRRANQSIVWEIAKKPFFIPCSLIESFLRQHLIG